VLLGQVMALSVITAGLTVAMYALAAVLSLVIATADNGATSWPAGVTILKAVGGTWLILECWTLFGMAMAFLLRQSAMAIGLGVAYMMAIEGILFVALGTLNISWLTSVEKFFVGQNANAIGTSFGPAISVRGLPSPVQLVSANQAVLVVALYTVAFVVLGVVLAWRAAATWPDQPRRQAKSQLPAWRPPRQAPGAPGPRLSWDRLKLWVGYVRGSTARSNRDRHALQSEDDR
jgi:ABC-2 type transport system permease protein